MYKVDHCIYSAVRNDVLIRAKSALPVHWFVQCLGFVQQGLFLYALRRLYFETDSEENNALCVEDYLSLVVD